MSLWSLSEHHRQILVPAGITVNPGESTSGKGLGLSVLYIKAEGSETFIKPNIKYQGMRHGEGDKTTGTHGKRQDLEQDPQQDMGAAGKEPGPATPKFRDAPAPRILGVTAPHFSAHLPFQEDSAAPTGTPRAPAHHPPPQHLQEPPQPRALQKSQFYFRSETTNQEEQKQKTKTKTPPQNPQKLQRMRNGPTSEPVRAQVGATYRLGGSGACGAPRLGVAPALPKGGRLKVHQAGGQERPRTGQVGKPRHGTGPGRGDREGLWGWVESSPWQPSPCKRSRL